MTDNRPIEPDSPFSITRLHEDPSGTLAQVLETMDRGGCGQHLNALENEATRVLSEIGQWIASGNGDPSDSMRSAFQDLAFGFRAGGVSLDAVLVELEHLEDALVGDPVVEDTADGPPGWQLRRALRILWTEVFEVNYAIARQRDQDRVDVVERFGEILSHELGNRLGAAQTGVLVLRDREGDLDVERRMEVLGLIEDGIDAALDTVSDVAAFMRAQRWQENERQPFSEVATRVARGLRPFAPAWKVRIGVAEDDLPDVHVDGGRVRLILSNFLMNSIRYADYEKDRPTAEVQGWLEDEDLVMQVSDNGVGIPEEEQGDVFRFRRRGRIGSEREGSGMGLTIAAEAVRQLGGRIELESEPGEGTTLRVYLPAQVSAEAIS